MMTIEQKIALFREQITKKLAVTPAGDEHDRLSDALARLETVATEVLVEPR